jgi:hypothetical protein
MNIKSSLKEHVDKIDKKLVRRIRMLVIILLVMVGVLVYEILTSHINLFWVLLGIVSGLIVGLIVGRMFSIRWHEENEKVIGKLDVIGGIVLIIYLAVSIVRNWIFAHWFVGAILTTFTISFVTGVMLGRILSLRFNIKRVLIEQGKM